MTKKNYGIIALTVLLIVLWFTGVAAQKSDTIGIISFFNVYEQKDVQGLIVAANGGYHRFVTKNTIKIGTLY